MQGPYCRKSEFKQEMYSFVSDCDDSFSHNQPGEAKANQVLIGMTAETERAIKGANTQNAYKISSFEKL